MSEPIRLRFAPSPTGKLHIGGARTALFNWAYARHWGGAFVLRIEDTDRERSKPEYEGAILEGLRWLGLDWDEGPDVGGPHGPYRQVARQAEHLAEVQRLLEAGQAYPCFCSPEELAELRAEQLAGKRKLAYDGRFRDLPRAEAEARVAAGEQPVIRFRVPAGRTHFRDLIRGDVSFSNDEVEDWIMVRADGTPTYNFVVVCDDLHMRISHVCRGEEHLTNTPKQVLLYRALGAEPPRFAHLPLMLGSDKKKLSKRTGDTALEDYRAQGYPPEAVVNFLCLQGWALDGATEVFSIDQLVANFDLADVSKGGSIFDLDKFNWLAGEYVRADSVERLAERCAPFAVAEEQVDAEWLAGHRDWFERAVASEQERFELYSQLPGRIAYLFASDEAVEYEAKAEKNARKHDNAAQILSEFRDWLRLRFFDEPDAAQLREGAKEWVAAQGLKFPQLFQPLRCALTGKPGGPDLFDIVLLLGPERSLARIERGIERLAVPAV